MSFEQVREFHEKFGSSVKKDGATANPDVISESLINLRIGLLVEEFIELIEATYGHKYAKTFQYFWKATHFFRTEKDKKFNRDIVEIADALGDIKYLCNGMALELGINLPAVENEIHRSNMSKLGEDGEPIVSDGTDGYPKGKILKGQNYSKPDIKNILETTNIE